VPLLILISVAAFAIMHAAPGGPMTIYARNSPVSGSQIARTRQSMGLDEPLPVQYIKWLGSLLRGDWGHSFASGRQSCQ
jgi:peptide/nickel transport system permease protein